MVALLAAPPPLFTHFPLRRSSSSPSFPPVPKQRTQRQRRRFGPVPLSPTSAMTDPTGDGRKPLLAMDFPYLSPSHRGLMSDLLSSVEDALGSELLPSSVPPDVRSFQNESGSSKGALDVVPGAPGSLVDFVLESWIHCELPFGALDITTLFAFLAPSATDAPHLLMEFIQSGPTSLVVLMDLLPRKDLVLHPDYLDHFYQQAQLDKPRQDLDKLPQVKPFCSSSLYVRSVLSPTAIAVNIGCEAGEGPGGMEEMMSVHVGGAAREMLRIWLEKCACGKREVDEAERLVLQKRDALIKTKAIEVDLTANLPRLFGQAVADRVVAAIQEAFGV